MAVKFLVNTHQLTLIFRLTSRQREKICTATHTSNIQKNANHTLYNVFEF